MSLLVTLNGSNYIIPETNEVGWGSNLDDYFVAIAAGVLQKTGGSFTLSAETDFGASYGLKSLYLKSRSSNVAAAGIVRLANNSDSISWRNALSNGDLALIVNASNQLSFNGTPLQSNALTSAHIFVGNGSGVATDIAMTGDIGIDNAGLTSISSGVIVNADVNAAAAIAYSKLNLSASIVNADVSGSAAIAYSKLNLATSIVNADINGSAAIAYSKLNLATSIVNADISVSAAIAYSKLALTGSIVNADVSASAAIAYSKLSLTGSIVNADVNASAAIAYSKLNLSTSIVNADVSTSAAIVYSKLSLTGSVVNADIAAAAAIAITKIAVGTANQVLGTNAGASANEYKTLTSTSNQVTVTHGVGTVTFSTPQDTATSSAVRFGSLTLGGALDASSILSLTSTTKGFLPPSMTTTQKNAISTPTDGLIVFDATLAQLYLRTGGAWTPLSTGGGSGTVSSGTAGRLTLYGAAGTTVTDTYVQNSQNINVAIASHAALASTRTYTIPESGADASFVMTAGTQTIAGAKTFSTDLAMSYSNNGGQAIATIANTSNTASSDAKIDISVAGSSANDPYIRFLVTGQSAWSIGTDNSDNDNFQIINASSLGSGAAIIVDRTTTGVAIHGSNTNDSATAGYVGEVKESVVSATNFPTTTNYGDLTSISLTAGDWLVSANAYIQQNGAAMTTSVIGISVTSGNSTTGLIQGSNSFTFAPATTNTIFPQTIAMYHIQLSSTTTVYFKYAGVFTVATPQASGRITAVRIR